MTEGVKAKALHGPGRGSGHTSGHHTCHVSRVRTLESGLQTETVSPRALVLSGAVDEHPDGAGLSDGIFTTP